METPSPSADSQSRFPTLRHCFDRRTLFMLVAASTLPGCNSSTTQTVKFKSAKSTAVKVNVIYTVDVEIDGVEKMMECSKEVYDQLQSCPEEADIQITHGITRFVHTVHIPEKAKK